MITIKIVIGSTRPGRFGPKPAAWLMELARDVPNVTFELVDLADANLPLLDEPVPPSISAEYANEHTKAWAAQMVAADGFVFVVPEYNHSYAAATKNAFDYLYKEWVDKPIAFLSYGAGAGGTRAIEHLRTVVSNLKMFGISEHVIIPNYWEKLDEQGNFKPSEGQTKTAKEMLQQIAFWSEQFQVARAKKQG